MDTHRVAFATAEHLFRLYLMVVGGTGTEKEALTTAGAAVEAYLMDCGMSAQEAGRRRDDIMLSHSP